jgi:hypothetical protein
MKKYLLSLLVCGFAVAMTAQTQYYGETFEDGAASGWTLEDQWAFGDNASLSSLYLNYGGNPTNFAAFNDDGAGGMHVGGGRIVSPSIDLTGVAAPLILEANVFFSDADFQGANETFVLRVSVDNGTTWDVVEDYGNEAWTRKIYDFDQYAGETIILAFEYTDGNAWNFGAAIDDIGISDDLVFTPLRSYDVSLRGGSIFDGVQPNIDYTVQGLFVNDATALEPVMVTSFEVEVANQTSANTYTFDNVNIAPGAFMNFDIPESVNTGDVDNSYTITVVGINGESMADHSGVSFGQNLNFAPINNLNPDHGVLVEEATGAWCPWCPRGTVFLAEMSKRFPDNFVGVAVHNADILTVPAYDGGLTSFPGFTGFPGVIFNRSTFMDPSEIVNPTIALATTTPVATLELGGEDNGGVLSTSAKVTFNQEITANHNIVIVLTEDGLSSPAATWNQANNYTGGAAGPMGGWEYMVADVPSDIFPYDHVGRALIGGFDGVNEVIGEYTVGSSPSVFMPDFTVPPTWNTDNMHIVGILTDNVTGRVVNAISRKYSEVVAAGNVSSTEEILDADFIQVYPNPADDIAQIAISLENSSRVTANLLDNLGRKVSTQNFGEIQGNSTLRLDVSELISGSYILQLRVDDKLVIKKLNVR